MTFKPRMVGKISPPFDFDLFGDAEREFSVDADRFPSIRFLEN